MNTYQSPIPIFKLFFRQLLSTSWILVIVIAFNFFFPNTLFQSGISFFISIMFVKVCFDSLDARRLVRIAFDDDKREVALFYRSLFTGSGSKIVSFNEVVLQTSTYKPIFTLAGDKKQVLYFFKKKKEVFLMRESKDGFRNDDVKEIIAAFEQRLLPVKLY